jgi:hypothetical protein
VLLCGFKHLQSVDWAEAAFDAIAELVGQILVLHEGLVPTL